MKLALFHNLPSGGAKRAAYELVKRAAARHEFTLYLIDAGAEEFLDLRPLVANCYVEQCSPRTGGARGVLETMCICRKGYQRIADKINAGRYDAVVVFQDRFCNSPFLLRYLHVPSLYFCHEPMARNLEPQHVIKGRGAWVKRLIQRYAISVDRSNARCASMICANSRFSVESLYRAFGVYPCFNRLGVDFERFKPADLQRRTDEVLSVGSLTVAKAHRFIIESVATLPMPPAVRIVYNFAAAGEEVALEGLAHDCGIRLVLDKMVSESDLILAYNKAAVTAYAPILEPFGLVPLESMACGTPVVGVAEGGVRETILQEETGILTQRDPVEFGAAINRLLRDQKLNERISNAARNYVESEWSWDRSCADFEMNLARVV